MYKPDLAGSRYNSIIVKCCTHDCWQVDTHDPALIPGVPAPDRLLAEASLLDAVTCQQIHDTDSLDRPSFAGGGSVAPKLLPQSSRDALAAPPDDGANC